MSGAPSLSGIVGAPLLAGLGAWQRGLGGALLILFGVSYLAFAITR